MFQNETRLNEPVSNCYCLTPGFHCLPYLFAPINCFFLVQHLVNGQLWLLALKAVKKANLLIMIES
jgi:hypothetical protein